MADKFSFEFWRFLNTGVTQRVTELKVYSMSCENHANHYIDLTRHWTSLNRTCGYQILNIVNLITYSRVRFVLL